MRDEIASKVIAIIADSIDVSPEYVSLDTSFAELQMNSLDGLRVIVSLENEFQVSIPNDQALAIRSVRQAIESLEKLLSSDGAGAALAQG